MNRWGALVPRPPWEGWGGCLGVAELSCLEPHPESQALLISLVPPNIEPDLVNKAVLENASVTLECLASGVPPPGK